MRTVNADSNSWIEDEHRAPGALGQKVDVSRFRLVIAMTNLVASFALPVMAADNSLFLGLAVGQFAIITGDTVKSDK